MRLPAFAWAEDTDARLKLIVYLFSVLEYRQMNIVPPAGGNIARRKRGSRVTMRMLKDEFICMRCSATLRKLLGLYVCKCGITKKLNIRRVSNLSQHSSEGGGMEVMDQ